jgi:hypothetical protein
MTAQRFTISTSGRDHISAPRRNKRGRISTSYFKDLILIYVLVNGFYKPTNFKDYVESLNVLDQEDWKQMPTRHYVEWKHYSDAAKQQLFETGLLTETGQGRFEIPPHKFGGVLNRVSSYVERVTSQAQS